jgi:uncharacterized integral membrane protein
MGDSIFPVKIKEKIMYITLIVTFLLILAVVIPGLQNNTPATLKFFFWEIEATLTAMIFYSALLGAAIVAILILPKLARKYLDLRNLKKQLSALKEKAIETDVDPV